MIIELMWKPFYVLLNLLISFIPVAFQVPAWLLDTLVLVRKGLSFFPDGVSHILFSNIIFWVTGMTLWGIIEWCYKKIPGVD